MLRAMEPKARQAGGSLLRGTKKTGVYLLIVLRPELAWAARQYRDKQTIGYVTVYTTEQTRIFAAGSILLGCSRATSNAEKGGPGI